MSAFTDVAPFVGAWIEILPWRYNIYKQDVAPFVGAWIEIRTMTTTISKLAVSLRSSERGLKLLAALVIAIYSRRSVRRSVD